VLRCRVGGRHFLTSGWSLTPLRDVDAVIHVASPLAGRGDAASTIDVGATPVFPMGTSTDVIYLRSTECSPRIDEHPPSSHRHRNQAVLDCEQHRGHHGLYQRNGLDESY